MFKKLFKPQNFRNLKVLITATLFAAISIVCGKYLAINVGEVLRFSFENITIILSGIMFGPLVGAVTGFVADAVGCLLVGYALNPILTFAAMFIGFISGLTFVMFKTHNVYINSLIVILAAHTLGSVVIKSFGLSLWYGSPFWETLIIRSVNYLIVAAAEYAILIAILKNRSFYNQLIKMTGVKNEL